MLKYEGIAGVPRVFDGFEILRQIGSGAMGAVYLARDIALDRRVAIKLISPRIHDPIARQRLVREARAIARLQHPNIVAIYRIGEVGGQPYLAYEYVDGTSLDQLPRPTDWLTVLKIGIGLSRGIAAAHHRGILHRDIKAPKFDGVSRGSPRRGSSEEIRGGQDADACGYPPADLAAPVKCHSVLLSSKSQTARPLNIRLSSSAARCRYSARSRMRSITSLQWFSRR
jgi:serine/threonine protein kinase